MFIDQVGIEVKAGDGGNGIVAFRREAMVELGGPFGGTGGKGASVILVVDEGLKTLLDFSYNKKYTADNGQNGMSKGKTGRGADDLILKVPPGTVVSDEDTGRFIGDLVEHGDQLVIATGGRGGRGNLALAQAGRQSLEISENGEPGEFINIKLELKLLADVGLVGFPSVGKSTFISVISKVKPKIADYHFTTLVPNLGVVKPNDRSSYVVADLPGLIEGAHLGKGLGVQFLRHIERTRLILHIVDMGAIELRDPISDYEIINKELESYKMNLLTRPQLVVANKMDLPNAQENLALFKAKYPDVEVIEISSVTKAGIDYLVDRTGLKLEEIGNVVYKADGPVKKVYRFIEEQEYFVYRDEDDNVLTVDGPAIEKLIAMTNFQTFDNTRRFANQLKGMGLYERLEELGAQPGEHVRVLGYDFQYDQ